MTDTNTRLTGLFGNPVAHSVSPAMHNSVFQALGMNYIYLAFQVAEKELAAAVSGIRGMGLAGVNVTLPYKTAVLPLLDKLEPQAERIGAINTIVNDNGCLTGYNTDAAGFMTALRGSGYRCEGQKAVVLGAGGAARALVFALIRTGTEVAIINRTFRKAEALAEETGAAAFEMHDNGYRKALEGASLVVNATSIGMSPGETASPLPPGLLRPGLTVFDTVYRPRQTRLMSEARASGCAVIGGLEMLLEQGVLSFELWTGRAAPREVMRQSAEAALE